MPGCRNSESKVDLHGFIDHELPSGVFLVKPGEGFHEGLDGRIQQHRCLGLLDEGLQHVGLARVPCPFE